MSQVDSSMKTLTWAPSANDLYSGLVCPKSSVWTGHTLAPVVFVWLAVPVSEQRWPWPGVCLIIGGGSAAFVSLLVCELVTSYNS